MSYNNVRTISVDERDGPETMLEQVKDIGKLLAKGYEVKAQTATANLAIVWLIKECSGEDDE